MTQSNTTGQPSAITTTQYGPLPFTTPVAQQNVGSVVATTVSVSTTSAIWGFSTSTQANAVIAAVASIQQALKNLGLSA